MGSTATALSAPLLPTYQPSTGPESRHVQSTITTLNLLPHVEGGYFALTDTAPGSLPSPYPHTPVSEATIAATGGLRQGFDPSVRLLSSTIFYYLTPNRPQGHFHANRSRIIHTLHRGRGRYVLIHPDGRVQSFVVGHDIERGERLQWIVEGGVWKASFLLDVDGQGRDENQGLLISETVVPGFEYSDHEFLTRERCRDILPSETASELDWLINKGEHFTAVEETTKVLEEDQFPIDSSVPIVPDKKFHETTVDVVAAPTSSLKAS